LPTGRRATDFLGNSVREFVSSDAQVQVKKRSILYSPLVIPVPLDSSDVACRAIPFLERIALSNEFFHDQPHYSPLFWIALSRVELHRSLQTSFCYLYVSLHQITLSRVELRLQSPQRHFQSSFPVQPSSVTYTSVSIRSR
jgi:hypothetical protein